MSGDPASFTALDGVHLAFLFVVEPGVVTGRQPSGQGVENQADGGNPQATNEDGPVERRENEQGPAEADDSRDQTRDLVLEELDALLQHSEARRLGRGAARRVLSDELLAQPPKHPCVRPTVHETAGDPDPHGSDPEGGELVETARRVREHAVDGAADHQRKQGPAGRLQKDQRQGQGEPAGEPFQKTEQPRDLRLSKENPTAGSPRFLRVVTSGVDQTYGNWRDAPRSGNRTACPHLPGSRSARLGRRPGLRQRPGCMGNALSALPSPGAGVLPPNPSGGLRGRPGSGDHDEDALPAGLLR